MKLEEGKFYRTRSGAKVGPAERYAGLSGIWVCKAPIEKTSTYTEIAYNEDGAYYDNHPEHQMSIVAEWSDIRNSEDVPTIDQVNFRQLQKGVAKIWDSYRI